MSNNSAVIFRNVSKHFNDSIAVNKINFEVKSGQLVTLLGPSGCGKTTTLRMVAGLELPTEGQIIIGDEDVSTVYAAGRSVGMVFQSYALFPHMTVIQNICFGLSDKSKDKEETLDKAHKALQTVGLKNLDNRYPSELSGGQQQRVAIARSIVTNPKVLLFDEPLSNLDAKLRRQVREDIRDLQKELGVTSIYVTHDQEEALAISDEIIVMKDGEINQKGSPKSLYQFPENPFVAQFIGEANKVPGILRKVSSDQFHGVAFMVGEHTAFTYKKQKSKEEIDKNSHAFIRPNAITFLPEASTEKNSFTSKILSAVYMGSFVEYRISAPWGGELFMIDYSFNPVSKVGSHVHACIDARGVSVVQ